MLDTIRVLLVDDHTVLRAGLRALLESDAVGDELPQAFLRAAGAEYAECAVLRPAQPARGIDDALDARFGDTQPDLHARGVVGFGLQSCCLRFVERDLQVAVRAVICTGES